MKAVMLSLRPQWCEKIFNGSKSIEIRKSRPSIPTPFKVYVYQTKIKFKVKNWQENFQSIVFTPNGGVEEGNGKVIGSFVCDRIDEYTFSDYEAQYRINDVDLMKTCLNFPELIAYGKGKTIYGWHISDLKIYDNPKELGEFWAYNAELHKRFANEEDFCCYNGTNEYGELLNECALFNADIKRCYSCWEEWSGWCHRITRPPQSWYYVEEME